LSPRAVRLTPATAVAGSPRPCAPPAPAVQVLPLRQARLLLPLLLLCTVPARLAAATPAAAAPAPAAPTFASPAPAAPAPGFPAGLRAPSSKPPPGPAAGAASPPQLLAPRPVALAAPLPAVTVALPAKALTVGDPAEAVITLRVPAAARLAGEPRFPVWRGAWGEAEVRRQDEPRRATGPDGAAVYTQSLVLAAFHPGKIALPPAAIAVPLGAGTIQAWTPAGIALTVRSVLPAGAAAKDLRPRPPAPLRRLPLGAAFFWTFAGLAAAAAAGIWALWQRARRRRAASGDEARARPLLEPLPELLAALDQLAAEPSPVVLHTGISQALRRYLGRAVGFPAPESTTTEIQRLLLARGWPSAQVRPAVELLRACDLVKFARQHAPAESARQRLAATRRLGEQTAERAAAGEQARARLEAAG
jgi:hypothetical protein